MRRGARPRALRRYGQNHLVDRGTLEAIVAMTGVTPHDVVLEVGAADGALTVPLLDRAAAVHAFEIDPRFFPALERLAAERPALSVHVGDALAADLSALEPPPTLFAANLAYNIAIPMIVRSLRDLPSLRRWAVMVQKELGDRLFAAPSTKAYSAVSVIVQLACTRVAARAVPRTVFSPRPRVDSQFLVFERRTSAAAHPTPTAASAEPVSTAAPLPEAPASSDAVEHLVRQAFAQRRKMLVNSLAGTLWPSRASGHGAWAGAETAAVPEAGCRPLAAADVRAALRSLGLPERARPEELRPQQFVELAGRLQQVRRDAAE